MLIEKKRNTEGEFFVNFFEFCNMRCSFCWQDHTNLAGSESVVEKAYDIIDRVRVDHRTHFIINLMGGELFADSLPDSLFEDYYNHVVYLHEHFPTGKTFHVNWVTNLVYEKIDRVIGLIEKCRTKVTCNLTTSFDFAGRFTKDQKILFEKNLPIARPYLGTVSVVLTKPNIERMMKSKDTLFEKMYEEGYYFYFDYYSPEKNFQFNAPSEKLLQDGLLFLLKNYPEVWPIKGWKINDVNRMTCMGSMIIDHTGYKGQCRSLLTSSVSNKMNSKVDLEDNSTMEKTFINKYNCSECEFFHKCGMGCFLQHDFKGKEELDECLYKEVFREIERC
jgi:radical SAM protein with 4Fe4S-binding SPASM domain